MIIPAEESVLEVCKRRGISRRQFLEYCAAVTATLALPSTYATAVAQALGQKRKPVLVWLEFQDCAGNTESMLRSSHPIRRGRRPGNALVGVPRDHYGRIRPCRRGRLEPGCSRGEGQVSGHCGGSDTHCRRRCLLHHRRTHGSRYRPRSLHRRGGQPCRRRLRVGWRSGPFQPESDRCGWLAGSRTWAERGELARLPA